MLKGIFSPVIKSIVHTYTKRKNFFHEAKPQDPINFVRSDCMISSSLLGTVLSCLFIALYWTLFSGARRRPKLKSLMIGALPVSVAAILAEGIVIPLLSVFVFLVIVAPVTEEALKLAGSSYRRDMAAGLGIGLGFALSENALYFGSFLSAGVLVPLSFLISFVLLRGLADPVLHAFTAALSVGTWRTRKWRWLGYSMLIHGGYNLVAFIGLSSLAIIAPADALITIALITAFLLWMRNSPSHIRITYRELTAEQRKQTVASMFPHFRANTGSKQQKRRFATWQMPWREHADATVDLQAPAAIAPPQNPSKDDFLAWVRAHSTGHGFNAVADALQLEQGYEPARWVRRSTYVSDGRQGHFMEIGRAGVAAIVGIVLGAALMIWLVFF